MPDHHRQDSKRSPDNYKKHLNIYCQLLVCTYKQTVSSNNQSMFVIHATAKKLLKPEKKIKRTIFTICSILRDLRLFKIMIIKKEHEQKNRKKLLNSLTALRDLSKVWRMEKKQHLTLGSTTHSISVLISPYLSGSYIRLHDLHGRSWIFHPNGELLVSCYGPQAKVRQAASTLHKWLPNYAQEVWKNRIK